jgi:DNA topoisomerase-1
MENVLTEAVSPVAFAKEAGLRYLMDNVPGFQRIKKGDGYVYLDTAGKKITDKKIIERINALRIPHVWEQVWICPIAHGHLQATGFDSKNRKQYRYHARWQHSRNNKKFSKMLEFGKALSQLREKIDHDMEEKYLSRNKILAIVVSLLDNTLIRIGNKCYEKANNSYGLTTLRDKHVKIESGGMKISFVGKKSVCQEVVLTDQRLMKLVKKCKDIPGYQLFQYYSEDGKRYPVSSEDVNGYLKENTGIDLSAKDFRTWGGSVTALKKLLEEPRPETEKEVQKKIVDTVKMVASKLGNTTAVCRSYYIHPLVLESYAANTLKEAIPEAAEMDEEENKWLQQEEIIFLNLLQANSGDS